MVVRPTRSTRSSLHTAPLVGSFDLLEERVFLTGDRAVVFE